MPLESLMLQLYLDAVKTRGKLSAIFFGRFYGSCRAYASSCWRLLGSGRFWCDGFTCRTQFGTNRCCSTTVSLRSTSQASISKPLRFSMHEWTFLSAKMDSKMSLSWNSSSRRCFFAMGRKQRTLSWTRWLDDWTATWSMTTGADGELSRWSGLGSGIRDTTRVNLLGVRVYTLLRCRRTHSDRYGREAFNVSV